MKNRLFISFSENLIFLCISTKNNEFHFVSFLKQRLDSQLVSSFENLLEKFKLSIDDLEEIYLKNRHSTWNANRLVVVFCKTISIFKKKDIFVLNDESKTTDEAEKNFFEKGLFSNELKSYCRFLEPTNLSPFYDSCKIINT